MGHQINYYMGRKNELEFIDFVISNKFDFIFDDRESHIVSKLDVKSIILQIPNLFLHKESYGSIIQFCDKNGTLYGVDQCKSPVIEFNRTLIHDQSHQIRRGRLWIGSEQAEFSDNILRDFKLLVKWLKKRLPYQEIPYRNVMNDDVIYIKAYADLEIKNKAENGYILM